MNLTQFRKLIQEEVRLFEKGRTGLPGQVEKDINIALRNNYKEDNINYGGCGAMAKLLYYACKKHLGITPKIVCLLATYKFLEKNAKSVNLSNVDSLVDLNDEGLSLIHIIVQIPGTNVCLDSDGFHSLDWFMKTYYNKCLPPESQKIATMVSNDSVSIQMLSKWVNQSFNWNRTFSRGRIPDLAKEVEELMSKAAKIPAIQSVVRTESVKSLHEKTQEEINTEKEEIQASMKNVITQKKALDAKMKVLRDRLTSINSQKAEKPTTSPTV
jgi:hypothetical protein